MNKPQIAFYKENGPAVIRGGCTITNIDGTTTDHDTDVFLCCCGHSKKKPYCDGTHKELSIVNE